MTPSGADAARTMKVRGNVSVSRRRAN